MPILRRMAFVAAVIAFSSAAPLAQVAVTTPRQQLGHDIGADYVLPDYTAFMA